MQPEENISNSQIEAIPTTTPNPTILSVVKKYSTIKDVFFYIAIFIVIIGMSIFSSSETSFASALFTIIITIVNLVCLAIFLGISNSVFKNVTKSLKGFRIGILAQQSDIQALSKSDVVKPVRFFTIPYILVTCIMLTTWYSRPLANIGLTFFESLDRYISQGIVFSIFFQLLSLMWIPYTMVRIVLWLNSKFQKSNLEHAEKNGLSYEKNPEKFIEPSNISLIILSVYLAVWGGVNLFLFLSI